MSDDKPDIEQLLEHYGSRTKGRNKYVTNCPLHEDRTPSFSVKVDDGLWNCFSCGKSGDVYTLIELKEETDFNGARAFAASLGLSAGGSGGGDSGVSGSRYAGGRKVSPGKGSGSGTSNYVPAWRRR